MAAGATRVTMSTIIKWPVLMVDVMVGGGCCGGCDGGWLLWWL